MTEKGNPKKHAHLESIPLLSFEPGGVLNRPAMLSDYPRIG